MTACDVIVVGGGLSGWLAAALLAQGGKRVRLVEKRRRFGGRAATLEKGGVDLNLGAHAVYGDGEMRAVLAGLGVLADQLHRVPPSLGWLALSTLLSGAR